MAISPSINWNQSLELLHSRRLAAALGLLSHYALNNGEWDQSSHLLATVPPVVFCILALVGYLVDPQIDSIATALQVTLVTAAVYLGTLISSILVYRAFFHRLRDVSSLKVLPNVY